MSTLAIKGHATRGSEVIEILGILGGSNAFGHIGNNPQAIYYIDENYKYFITCSETKKVCDYIIFTLEEFLEKYPYKVGGMARLSRSNIAVIIKAIKWKNDEIVYQLSCDDSRLWSVDNLKPYKEETIEERQYKELRMPLDDDDKLATEVTIDGNKILPPNGYLIGKITQVDNGMLVEYVKQKPQYPKTYEECCEVLDYEPDRQIVTGYDAELIENFQKLLICRDAYWKIAGDWKPDWNTEEDKYTIYTSRDIIVRHKGWSSNYILAFPTEEMRDAFYENFKDLIEQCKELL